jgi:antitoxin ParD1/3/4
LIICGTYAIFGIKYKKEIVEMAEGVNVRITGKLRRFIENQASPDGLYESASEYVRDLVRRDYERKEKRKWSWLIDQLQPGMEADESEFIPLDAEEIIKTAKKEKAGNAS